MILDFLLSVLSFIFFISLLIFIHEYGHYYTARFFNVRVLSFSIGFGKVLWSKVDKKGTRWQISLLPLGGYVKMYGEQNIYNNNSKDGSDDIDEAQSFAHKKLYQRFLIVLAGPAVNILLAILIMWGMIFTQGSLTTTSEITSIIKDSPAEKSNLKPGDVIQKINNYQTNSFQDIQNALNLITNKNIQLTILRNENIIHKKLELQEVTDKDFLGNKITRYFIGIRSGQTTHKDIYFFEALQLSLLKSAQITQATFTIIYQIVTLQRTISQLQGPIKIAQYSGQVSKKILTEPPTQSLFIILWFIAMISLNIGIFNLLPIPMLDGGHLFLYVLEFIRKKPLSLSFQKSLFLLGAVMMLSLFITTITNDLISILS